MAQNAGIHSSNDGLQFVSQVMSMYPSQWSPATVPVVLMDVAALGKENHPSDASRLHRLKGSLIFPLARICLHEKETMKKEKEKVFMKEQQLRGALLSIQEEQRKSLQRIGEDTERITQQEKFIETLLSDLDRMAQASERNKKVIQQLQHTLLVKDLELQNLASEKENLLFKIMEVGPKALLEWAKDELQARNLDEDLRKKCLDWVAIAPEESVCEQKAYDCKSSVGSTISNTTSTDNNSTLTTVSPKYNVKQPLFVRERESGKNGLIEVVLLGVWHEGVSGFQLIQEYGIFSFPAAILHFWRGLAGRIVDHMAEILLLKVRQSSLGFCFQLL